MATRKITPQGYVAVYTGPDEWTLEHRLVWESEVGRIPVGNYHIHHKNGDGQDNRIENLELLSTSDHKRLHAGWLRDGGGAWTHKPCCKCHILLPLKEFNVSGGSVGSYCLRCRREHNNAYRWNTGRRVRRNDCYLRDVVTIPAVAK